MAESDPIPALLPVVVHSGRFASDRNVGHHTHPGTELVFVTRGACRVEVGKDNWLAGDKGVMFVLPAGVPQYQETLGFTRTTYITFTAPPPAFSPEARTIRVPTGDPVEAWMEHLCDLEAEIKTRNSDPLAASALLLACLVRLAAIETHKQTRDTLHPALGRALRHLETYMAEPFRADNLARRTGLSVSHMNTLFRRHLGCSPLRYLQDLRLRHAQTLLLSPYARVREVAAACGYDDTNYFVRLFRRQFKVSPGRWRRQSNVQNPP